MQWYVVIVIARQGLSTGGSKKSEPSGRSYGARSSKCGQARGYQALGERI